MKTFTRLLIFLFGLSLAVETFGACDVTATNMSFGNYDVFLSTPVVTTGTITVRCGLLDLGNVIISIGPSGNSGGFNPRQMKHSTQSDRLSYNLFTNSSMNSIWGNGTGGTATVSCPVLLGAPCARTVFARVPQLQDVSVGSYNDTVVVTITF